VLILGCVRSFTYAIRWNDRLEFYRNSLDEQPESIRLYMLLASEYTSRRQFEEAERVIARGREMLPEYWEIWTHSGVIAMEQQKFDEAQRYFERAMEINPSHRIQGWMDHLSERRAAATTTTTRPAPPGR
jgi:tetratricopeptide (TPR) repeat protein